MVRAKAGMEPDERKAYEMPLFRSTDPDTSREAGERVAPFLSALQSRVMGAYIKHGPMTAKEAEALPEFAGVGFSTTRKRVSELHKAGRLEDTGERRDGCAVLRARQ